MNRTVAELLESISSRELTEWIILNNIEPFGEERADYRQAVTSCILANAYRDKKRKPMPFKVEDFMIGQKQNEQEVMSADQIKAVMSRFRRDKK